MLYLKNLTYHPTASPDPILKSVNLKLESKKLGLIIGPSGSGKSTMLEILSGLAEPTSGSMSWVSEGGSGSEQELVPEQMQQLAGLVFQFPERHFCGGTISEELRLGHPEIGTTRVEETLSEVGLEHLSLSTKPHALSGGQQRRLALAVQLIRQPHILLLDEPTAGLDWSMRRQLVNLLTKLKQHRTLLVVTHDAGDMLEIADCCWSISHGELKSIDPITLEANSKHPLPAA